MSDKNPVDQDVLNTIGVNQHGDCQQITGFTKKQITEVFLKFIENKNPEQIMRMFVEFCLQRQDTTGNHNCHGGLTLVTTPGYENLAHELQRLIIEIEDQFRVKRVDIVKPYLGERKSGEPYCQLEKKHIGGHDCVLLTSGPGTKSMLMDTFLTLRYLAGRRARRIAVVSGYFPLGRSDKDEGFKEFALPPLVIDLMMASCYQKLDRIISVDLHAPQVVMSGRTGLVTEISLVAKSLLEVVKTCLEYGDPIKFAFPDNSAEKRTRTPVLQVCSQLGVPYETIIIGKLRQDSGTTQITGVYGENDKVKGSTTIMVDDELATANTNISAGKILRQLGAKRVISNITHLIACENAVERLNDPECSIDEVHASDTVSTENRWEITELIDKGKIVIHSWKEILARIIYNHHWDLDIRRIT